MKESNSLWQFSQITIDEMKTLPTNLQVGEFLHELGLLYFNKGNIEEAEGFYNQSLLMLKQYLEPTHLSIAEALNNLANLYQVQLKYKEAEDIYLQILPIFEQYLGLEHVDLATVINNFASVYRKQKKFDKALSLYSQSYLIWEKQLGLDSEMLGVSLNEQGLLHVAMGEFDKAEQCYKQALAILNKIKGSNIAELLNNQAKVYLKQEKYKEALDLFEEAYSLDKLFLGETHYEVGMDLANIAEIYYLLSQYKLSNKHFKQAIAILKQHKDVSYLLEEVNKKYVLLQTATANM